MRLRIGFGLLLLAPLLFLALIQLGAPDAAWYATALGWATVFWLVTD